MSPKSDCAEREEPHDILAAEEFGVPAPDPDLHADEPHDVLAAEEFERNSRYRPATVATCTTSSMALRRAGAPRGSR